MRSTDRNRSVEGDDETTDVLHFIENRRIGVLHQQDHLRMQATGNLGAVLTLAQDITSRRLGAPIGTIPMILNTSTQNNGYNPAINPSKLAHTR